MITTILAKVWMTSRFPQTRTFKKAMKKEVTNRIFPQPCLPEHNTCFRQTQLMLTLITSPRFKSRLVTGHGLPRV